MKKSKTREEVRESENEPGKDGRRRCVPFLNTRDGKNKIHRTTEKGLNCLSEIGSKSEIFLTVIPDSPAELIRTDHAFYDSVRKSPYTDPLENALEPVQMTQMWLSVCVILPRTDHLANALTVTAIQDLNKNFFDF